MDYYYSKIKNPRVLKILFKMSAFSVLACFLALFVGSMKGNKVALVKDDKGFEGQVVLTGNYDKNMQILRDDRNVKLQPKDEVSFAENGHEHTCYIKRSIPIELDIDHVVSKIDAKPGVSVEQSLQEAGLNLSEDDELIIEKPGVEAKLEKDGGLNRNIEVENGLKVTVKKANFNTRVVDNEIDYKTEEKLDANLEEGKKKIEVKGEKGLAKVELQEKIVDGKVVEVKQIGESKVVKEPKNEVVIKGTKKPSKREQNDVASTGGKKDGRHKKGKHSKASTVTTPKAANVKTGQPGKSGVAVGYATSYSVGKVTSCGTRPGPGTVAVNPKVIPYGSKLTVRDRRNGKVIYTGTACDNCPTAVRTTSKGEKGVVADLYRANIGKVPVTVEWSRN